MFRPHPLVAVACCLIGACATGPSIAKFTPAHGPGGARVVVTVSDRTVAGELLAVEDTALFLAVRVPELPNSGATLPLVRVPVRAIRHVEGIYSIHGSWTSGNRDAYRKISRYPAGVNEQLERRILVAYQTDRVVWVTP